MKIFVDTGSIKDIQTIADLGILDGVTTNPSLLAKEPGDFKANLKKICDIVKGPVSGEVTATDFAGMMREGHDIATSGMELIREIVTIYDNYNFKTEVLVASCRHPIHIVEAAKMGADICTCPPPVIDMLYNHPLTNIGLEKFLKDWEKSQAVKA